MEARLAVQKWHPKWTKHMPPPDTHIFCATLTVNMLSDHCLKLRQITLCVTFWSFLRHFMLFLILMILVNNRTDDYERWQERNYKYSSDDKILQCLLGGTEENHESIKVAILSNTNFNFMSPALISICKECLNKISSCDRFCFR